MFNLKIQIMANFTSDDLAFTGYSKTVNSNNPEKSNTIYLDKTEEFEVVNFCNQFLEKYKVPKTKASFQKVESFLQHSNLEHQIYKEELADWIASNWIKI